MEFDIQPCDSMKMEPNSIRLPEDVREDLGILLGQFLQIKGRGELVLQVIPQPDKRVKVALISPTNFHKIQGKSVEFKVLDVTLGCDPEFFILWDRSIISAATYLPFQGQIGCDGQLGELRPMYARHEDSVVGNLGQLIPSIPGSMKRMEWAKNLPIGGESFRYEAHSYYRGLAAGFHVHLGIPPEILNTRKEFNRGAMNHLVQCLDWYVSVPLIPLENNHTRRLGTTNYGRPGDYRPSNITLEYRTPGAFYLRDPILTKGLLGLCLLVTENVVSRMKEASQDFINLHKLSKSDLNSIMPIPKPEQIKGTLLSKDMAKVKGKIEGIRSTLRDLPTYGKHERGLEEFFSVVESRRRPEANLLHNWEVVK